MVQYEPQPYRPTAEELLESDKTPVDNELQNLIRNFSQRVGTKHN